MSNNDDLVAKLAEAQNKITKLENEINSKKQKKVEIKVSEKGCIQINGIRKFPITFYRNELETIFNIKHELENFINDNKNDLKSK